MQDEKYQGYLGVTLLALILLVLYFFRYTPDFFRADILDKDTGNAPSIAASEGKFAGDTDISLTSHWLSINSATVSELIALPGIGKTLAERIVLKREEKHGFKSIDELLEIQGIGEQKLGVLKKYVKIKQQE